MKKNVGGTDRLLRVVAGLAIMGGGVYFQSWWGAVGVMPIFTALLGWCPPYAMLGISTCKASRA